MEIEIRNGNLEAGIRQLKKLMARDNVVAELRAREYHLTRSQRRKAKDARAASRRARHEQRRAGARP